MSVLKHWLLILIFALAQTAIVSDLCCQQVPQVSHYMFNPQFSNPASAGLTNSIVSSVIHRQQWYGGEGMPQTTLFSFDAPLRFIQSGIGLNVVNDKLGQFNNTSIQISYNYQFPAFNGTIIVGIQGGINSKGLQVSDVKAPETSEDPTIKGKEDASHFLFDVSPGVYYQVLDQYEIGISLGQVNQPAAHSELGIKDKRCLNLFGNYHFTMEQFPSIDFVPSTLIKSDFATTQMDISLLGVYQKLYWGGISYRFGDAVTLLGGLFIRQIQVGLAYDLATNQMIKASKIGGSFEIFARYNFNLSVDRLPQSYKNSRYL